MGCPSNSGQTHERKVCAALAFAGATHLSLLRPQLLFHVLDDRGVCRPYPTSFAAMLELLQCNLPIVIGIDHAKFTTNGSALSFDKVSPMGPAIFQAAWHCFLARGAIGVTAACAVPPASTDPNPSKRPYM
jgi:hypothetical protein